MADLRGEERSRYVQNMFGRIAGRYDLMNRLMTLGQDVRWRRFVVEKANLPPDGRLLDLATGTGDIAFLARGLFPEALVVGTDFSLAMMGVGRQRPLGNSIYWCQADALALPYPDNLFDAVVSGYLLRNVVDLERCLAEQWRVIRPGGMLVALDTTPPPRGLLRPFIDIHLRVVIPLLGRLISGSSDAYQYLPNSTQAFKLPGELERMLISTGFQKVAFQTLMFGTMAVHWGQKPST